MDKDEGKGSGGAVKEIAKDLVELYAARQNQDGFVYRGGYSLAERI